MANMGITLARFCLAAWIGAASLFVVTGVREVTTTNPILNNSPVKDALVAVRFPAYYAFGFTLTILAGIGIAISATRLQLSRKRFVASFSLVLISLALMTCDYVWIYSPLLEMVTPAGNPKPAEFVQYHEASKHINMTQLSLLFVASMVICWPTASSKNSHSS
ncbi:MAG: hypothetical protein Tsb009_14680 [Planctomycetaceae bacterium]